MSRHLDSDLNPLLAVGGCTLNLLSKGEWQLLRRLMESAPPVLCFSGGDGSPVLKVTFLYTINNSLCLSGSWKGDQSGPHSVHFLYLPPFWGGLVLDIHPVLATCGGVQM